MKKYVYQQLKAPTLEELNALGAQGWRIIKMDGGPSLWNDKRLACNSATLERETAFSDPSGDGRL